MASKKVTGEIRLQLPAGAANPAPPVGPALGAKGVNIMNFCKEFTRLDVCAMGRCATAPAELLYVEASTWQSFRERSQINL